MQSITDWGIIEISTKLVSNLHWGIFDLILVQLKAFLESAPPLAKSARLVGGQCPPTSV